MLLDVPDVDFVHELASNLVDDNQDQAYTSILTLAYSSASSAVTFPRLEVH
jgi:hypothetical protein